MNLTIADVMQAKRRIHPHLRATPVVSSSLLNQWLGHEVLFKAECLQRAGSFKARGACNFITSLFEQGQAPRHLVASSSGNHAQGVAWAAKRLGVPATIYMAGNVSPIKAQATRSYGAQVIMCETRTEADARVEEASRQPHTWWAPPFNHEWIIAGQGTAVLEALLEIGEVDAVFAPCGGGGLLSGSLIAARALSPKAQVIGVEPANANDAAESLRTGTIQSLKATPDTLADGAMTPQVGAITFEYLKRLDDFLLVNEDTIRYWTQWLSHLLKISVEPTSALAMGGVIQWLTRQRERKRVLIVLSGGNIDQTKMLKIYQNDCLTRVPSLEPMAAR